VAHTASCGHAKSRTCRCGGCAGSRHGWPGAIRLAQPEMAASRVANDRASERAWVDATKPRLRSGSRLRPTKRRSRAAVDGAKDDIENWLAAVLVDPSDPTGELLSAVGDVVGTDVFDALCEELGVANNNKTRADLAEKHLFCQVLAEAACSMQQIRDDVDRAIRQITVALLDYSVAGKGVKIPEGVAKVMADGTAKGIDRVLASMPIVRHFEDLQRAVRILAVMTCPAPENHEAVIRCALRPLGQPVVSQIVDQRLKTAMPNWVA